MSPFSHPKIRKEEVKTTAMFPPQQCSQRTRAFRKTPGDKGKTAERQ